MREININPRSILLEPFGRNTAPAITLAALKSLETENDPLLLVLSSDHEIKNENKFIEIIQKGTVINKKSNAEWTIQMRKPFVPFMKFPFKIVYVDDNYKYMAVGYPKNTMGWIMGRTSKITDEEYKKIMDSLEELGYKNEQFEFVQHD